MTHSSVQNAYIFGSVTLTISKSLIEICNGSNFVCQFESVEHCTKKEKAPHQDGKIQKASHSGVEITAKNTKEKLNM